MFKIAISIEKEVCAHRTLELRAFFRNFSVGKVPRRITIIYAKSCRVRSYLRSFLKKQLRQRMKLGMQRWAAQACQSDRLIIEFVKLLPTRLNGCSLVDLHVKHILL